jgi:hypothetical protein
MLGRRCLAVISAGSRRLRPILTIARGSRSLHTGQTTKGARSY